MKIITEEKFLKLTDAEKCQIIIKIIKKELVYQRSDIYEQDHQGNKTTQF